MEVQALDTAAGGIISGGDAWVTEWTSWSECRFVRRVECPAAENRSPFALGWRTRQRFCFSLSANSEATLGSSACTTSNAAFFERQACFPGNSTSTEKLDGVLSALLDNFFQRIIYTSTICHNSRTLTGIWSCWSDCISTESVKKRFCVMPEFWLDRPEQSPLGVIRSAPNTKYVSTTCPGLDLNSYNQIMSGEQFGDCEKPFVPDKPLPPQDSIEAGFSTVSTDATTTSGSPLFPADQPRLGQVSDQGSNVNNGSMRAAQANIDSQTSNDSGLVNPIHQAHILKLYLVMLFLAAALLVSLIVISVFCCCVCCGKKCGTSSLRKNRSREAAAHTSTSTTSSETSPSTPTSRTSGDQIIQLMPLEPPAYSKAQSVSPQSLSPRGISIGSPVNAFGVSYTIQPAAVSQLQQPPILSRQVSTTSQGDRARTSKPPSSPASPVSLDADSTLEHQPRSNDTAILSSFEHRSSGRQNGAAAALVSVLTSAAMVVPQPESPSHNYYNFSSPAQLNKLNSQPAGASSNIPEQPPLLQSLKLPSVQTRARLGTQSTYRSSATSDIDDLQSLSEIGSQHSKMSPCGPIYPLQSNASKLLNRLSPQISNDAESDRGAATTSNLATRRHAQQNSGQRLPRLLLASQQPSLPESPQNEEVPVALPLQSQQSAPRSPIPRSPPAAFAPGVIDPTIQQLIPSANGTLNGTWTTNTATLSSDDSMRLPLLPATPTAANASTPLYAGWRQLGGSGRAANETDVAITAQLLASPTQSEAPQVNGGLSRLSFSGGPQGAAAAAAGGVAAAVAVPGGRHVYEKSVSCTPSHESAVEPQQFTFEQRPRRLTGVTAPPVAQRPDRRSTRGSSVSSTRAGLDPPDSALPASIILTPNGVDDVVHVFP